jgi:hypothetical protein
VADGLLLELFRGGERFGKLQIVRIKSIAQNRVPVLTCFLQASLCGSGMLASTLLISPGPKPVTVLLCFGLVKLAGPTGPLKSASGALVDGRRSLAGGPVAAVAISRISMAKKGGIAERVRVKERVKAG